jgi:hypothetical protein
MGCLPSTGASDFALPSTVCYPLVNVYITTENHHFIAG